MTSQEFKERWDNVMQQKKGCERFSQLIYKTPHPSGKTRDEVLKEASRKQNKKNYMTVKYKENQKRYYQTHKEIINAKERLKYANNKELRELRKQRFYEYYNKNKDDPVFKAKTKEYRRKYYEKKKLQKFLQKQKNDDKRRAMEELARFTDEERKRFEEWEVKQNVSC